MKGILAATASLLIISSSAFAADLPTKKAPMAPLPPPAVYNWTGVYGGLNVGWGWSDNSYDTYRTNSGALTGSGSDNSNAFRGGGQIGYRYEFPGNFVVGAAASLDFVENTSSSSSSGTSSSVTHTGDSAGGAVTADLGYAFGDFLPYVLGGWAWADGNVSRTQLTGNGAPPVYTDSTSVQRNGWTVGAGAAYHIWGNWEVFGQYRYTDFENVDITYPTAKLRANSQLTENGVAFGVNYKF
jgi:outer membrane immunogenic protein